MYFNKRRSSPDRTQGPRAQAHHRGRAAQRNLVGTACRSLGPEDWGRKGTLGKKSPNNHKRGVVGRVLDVRKRRLGIDE